jgi:hypothetical protein
MLGNPTRDIATFLSIMSLPKWINGQLQQLILGDRSIVIPPLTSISPSILATHTYPHYWRNPLMWKPSRWIDTDHAPGPLSDLDAKKLVTSARTTFKPSSDGPQKPVLTSSFRRQNSWRLPLVSSSPIEFLSKGCLVKTQRRQERGF